MLREGQTTSAPLDALPGKRTSSIGPLPSIQGMASNVSSVRHNPIDTNNNSCTSENMKNKLPSLIMPSYHQPGHGIVDKVPTPPTTASLTPTSSGIFVPSDSGRKRPPNSNFTPMISAKRSCLPFGYCYDTTESDLWLIDDDHDMKLESSLPQIEEDSWMFSDFHDSLNQSDRTPDLLLSNNPWIGTRKNYRSKVRDVGPTLAQLNSSSDVSDQLDLDELLSCSSAVNTASAMSQTPKNVNQQQSSMNGIGTMKSGQVRGIKKEKENIAVRSAIELQDPKLQANVEYLQNLLVSNSVNQSTLDSLLTHNPTVTNLPKNSGKKNPIIKTIVQSTPNPDLQVTQVKTEVLSEEQPHQLPPANPAKTEKGGKKKLSCKKNVDSKKTSPKILGSILNVKQEKETDLDSPENEFPVETLDGEKVVPVSSESTSAGKEKQSIRRTRNSNSQSTERSNASSNDEGFVEEADAAGDDVDMEDVEEEEDDNESEVMDSDDESFYGDYEAKDLLGATTSDDQENRWALNMGRSRKGGPQRYFWQYNVQAKGPKGSKPPLGEPNDALDPHVLGEVSDPVFAPDCQVQGVKHAGKARRGDGNDLTPNPRKLLMIGLELKKLSKTINDLTPVADVPVASRNKTRKEKNKLASRACRLKKKAQHEANKIKLYGLQNEHEKMLKLLTEIKSQVRKVIVAENIRKVAALTASMANLFNDGVGNTIVAGNTSDFVNSVLDNVAAGQTDGGLR